MHVHTIPSPATIQATHGRRHDLAALFGAVAALAAPCAGQAGSLDPTFGTGGKVTTDFLEPGSNDEARSVVAVQADGKIVVAGFRSATGLDYDFVVARYHPDGSPDTAFGPGGTVTTDFGFGHDLAFGLAIQGDGKIVVAGNAVTSSGGRAFALARYQQDGSLDAGFGGGGKVTTDFGSSFDIAFAVAVQADGKIVAAGRTLTSSSGLDYALARYHPDGTLDAGFGSGGTVTTSLGASHDQPFAVAIQADGKIVAAGSTTTGVGQDFAVVRYLPDGSLDTSFDSDGSATTNFGATQNVALGVALQTDGKIVAAGYARLNGFEFALARYHTDGSLDAGFDGDGMVTTDFGPGTDWAYAVKVQPDGKIVAAGTIFASGSFVGDFGLARYHPDGSLDAGFGSGGRATTDFAGTDDRAYALALQADGQVVAAGRSETPAGGRDFALARYGTDGSLDAGFDGDGRVTTDIGGASRFDQAQDIVGVQADGKIVAVGRSSAAGQGNSDFAVARYHQDGSPDSTFGSTGQIATDFAGNWDQAESVAIQADGKIVVAGSAAAANTDFALARYDQNGNLDVGFGNGGKVTTDFASYDVAYAVALQTDGRIVVAGRTNSDIAVARYHADGSLDTGFGIGGKVITASGIASAIGVQSDGKILVAGVAGNSFGLVRYHSDGSLDATFGSGGKVSTSFPGTSYAWARDVALQADGKIVAAGPVDQDFGLARYHPDGSLDANFDNNGTLTTDLGGGYDVAFAVAVQGDGRILVSGASFVSTSFDFSMARYLADGTLDATFGNGGLVTTDFAQGTDGALAMGLFADKIVLGGVAQTDTSNFDFALARYLGFSDPLDLLEQLLQRVEALAAAGVLNHGRARSLQAKLEGAIAQVDRGNHGAASNKLGAFMNEVNAFVDAGILTQTDGQDLYDRAANIVALLSP